MNTTKLAISALCALLPFETLAGEAVLTFKVPKSAYAFEDTPKCAGWRQQTHELFKDKEFISGVSAYNPIAGAVVATIGFYDSLSANHGGEISKLIRKLHGGSYSSCMSTVYMLPRGTTAEYLELSNRHGALTTRIPLADGYWPLIIASDDWSAWRDVQVAKIDRRYFVSATATNWLHNGASNQVMRITWTSANKTLNSASQHFEIVGAPPPVPPSEGPLPRQ